MDLAEFRDYRDWFALTNMLERGRKLEVQSAAALKEVNRLRRWRGTLAKFSTGSGLQYHRTKEQFDYHMRVVNMREKLEARLDVAYRQWAAVDAQIMSILNDPRYQAWEAHQREVGAA